MSDEEPSLKAGHSRIGEVPRLRGERLTDVFVLVTHLGSTLPAVIASAILSVRGANGWKCIDKAKNSGAKVSV